MRRWRIDPALLVGDTLAFFVFAATGRASHNEAGGLTALGPVATTAAPFVLAWLLVAVPLGTLAAKSRQSAKGTVMRTTGTWLLAWPLGLALRVVLLRRGVPLSFALVVLITNAVTLAAWRLSAHAVMTRAFLR